MARHSYNWAVAKSQEYHKTKEKWSAYSLVKLQNSIKREEMPFYLNVSKCAPQYAIHDFGMAFEKMWKEKRGYPKFKKKGQRESYVAVENSYNFKQKNKKILLPRIGWVKCYEDLRFVGRSFKVIVKRVADLYFAYVYTEVKKEIPVSVPTLKPTPVESVGENQAIVGIDVGIKQMMVLSDGTIYENPKALKKNMKLLKRLQRSVSRKQKGSKNRHKAKIRVARKHYRVSNIRKNAIHQATSQIVKKYDVIVIENLNVKGMMKNRPLAQAVCDVAFGEISRQLAYKTIWQEKQLIKAPQFFASSKICSCCGHKKEKLLLSERVYVCEKCGYVDDRDKNAANNLEKYGLAVLNGSTDEMAGSKVCGELSSFSEMKSSNSMKQKVNKKITVLADNFYNVIVNT